MSERRNWCPCHGSSTNASCWLRGDEPVISIVMCDCKRVIKLRDGRYYHEAQCELGLVSKEPKAVEKKVVETPVWKTRKRNDQKRREEMLVNQMPLWISGEDA